MYVLDFYIENLRFLLIIQLIAFIFLYLMTYTLELRVSYNSISIADSA